MMLSNARRMAALVTAFNVLVACGYSFAGVVIPQAVLPPTTLPTLGAHIFALYAAARAGALAAVCLVVIARRDHRSLLVLGVLAGLIQLLDAGVGIAQHDSRKTLGPLVIAVLQFWVLVRLRRAVVECDAMQRRPGSAQP